MLLLIDNYDSFTHNIARYFTEVGAEVIVKRNDQITIPEIKILSPQYIVISPGPCTPNEAGISLAVIEQFAGNIPLLGICLGHQAIVQAFGGDIIKASQVMHGKTSPVTHNSQGCFKQLPNPFVATRYHSLVTDPTTLPAQFIITAQTDHPDNTNTIMGIKHRTLAIEGVQFHPESVLTEHGYQLLENFLRIYAENTCRSELAIA